VRPGTGIQLDRRYAGTLAGVWSRLSRALHGLELLAAEPWRLDESALERLPGLQYELHWATELLAGVEPPPGAEAAHHELAGALVGARDATADVAGAIEEGGSEAAALLLHEWRGALFRVRLARIRLTAGAPKQAPHAPSVQPRSAVAATGLVFAGAVGFAGGAVLALWPLWALGLVLVAAGVLAHRA
jgi:hypothetical protein